MVKKGEGISQRTCMNDPQTGTMVWGLTVGAGLWTEQKSAKGGKIGTTTIE